jgi:hypothetical protein
MDSQITLSPSPEEQFSQTARIDEALRHVLSSAPFHGSKQCQTLLRYIVENCLKGDEDVLKERTIGIEVFGRRPDYNTGDDPIVRARATRAVLPKPGGAGIPSSDSHSTRVISTHVRFSH